MNFMAFPLTSLSNVHARGEESLKSCGGDELRQPRGSRGRASPERATSASDLAARLTNAGFAWTWGLVVRHLAEHRLLLQYHL
ncbi:unnamed protein product [Calypogeia fissa]